jgi:hypothetical protein
MVMLDGLTAKELLEAPVEREQHITALELFFDLVSRARAGTTQPGFLG